MKNLLTFMGVVLPLLFFLFYSKKVNRKNELKVLGNIHEVLAGKIRDEIMVDIRPTDLECGLGCGTFARLDELGESILFDNKIYIKSTSSEKNYRIESSNRNFTDQNFIYRTPFTIGMSSNSKYLNEINVGGNKSLEKFFSEQLPFFENKCFGIYGRATFSLISTLAIKKSPMEGKSLMDDTNRPHYFHEEYIGENVEAIFVGIVIKKNTDFFQQYQSIGKNLFHNVYVENLKEEEEDILMSHVHVAVVREKDNFTSEEEKEEYFDTDNLEVVDVQHLFSKSRFEKGKIRIFDVQGMTDYIK